MYKMTTHVNMVSTLPRPFSVRADPSKCAAPGTNMPPFPSQLLLMLLQLPLLLLHAASITLFLLSHPSPFLRVQSALHLSSSLVLLFTPHSKPSPLSMTTQIPPIPPPIPLRRMSPRARQNTWPANSSGGHQQPPSSQHQYALHSMAHTHNSDLSTTQRERGNKPQHGLNAFCECTMAFRMHNANGTYGIL